MRACFCEWPVKENRLNKNPDKIYLTVTVVNMLPPFLMLTPETNIQNKGAYQKSLFPLPLVASRIVRSSEKMSIFT